MNNFKPHPLQASLLVAGALFGAAAPAAPLEDALSKAARTIEETVPGKIGLNYRIRWEQFDLDGSPRRSGVSHRLRYSYQTPELHGLTALAEGESLWALSNKTEIHPLDQQGSGTDLNQLWAAYSRKGAGNAKLGRQIYTLDDHRFIGHVGWRQNIQTFDGATGAITALDGFSLNAHYLDSVNRVTGAHDELDGTWGVNASYTFDGGVKVVGFFYRTGVEARQSLPRGINSDTVGVRVSGKYDAGTDLVFNYAGSYAYQTDHDNPVAAYDLSYFAGDVSADFKGFTIGGGVEILEGDGRSGFSTPFATVHQFNGFADVFLPVTNTSIRSGLNDYYAYLGYKIPLGGNRALPIKVIYHAFDANDVGTSYGWEIDVVASYKINKYMNTIAKLGHYETDSAGAGLGAGGFDKTMATVELNFVY